MKNVVIFVFLILFFANPGLSFSRHYNSDKTIYIGSKDDLIRVVELQDQLRYRKKRLAILQKSLGAEGVLRINTEKYSLILDSVDNLLEVSFYESEPWNSGVWIINLEGSYESLFRSLDLLIAFAESLLSSVNGGYDGVLGSLQLLGDRAELITID